VSRESVGTTRQGGGRRKNARGRQAGDPTGGGNYHLPMVDAPPRAAQAAVAAAPAAAAAAAISPRKRGTWRMPIRESNPPRRHDVTVGSAAGGSSVRLANSSRTDVVLLVRALENALVLPAQTRACGWHRWRRAGRPDLDPRRPPPGTYARNPPTHPSTGRIASLVHPQTSRRLTSLSSTRVDCSST